MPGISLPKLIPPATFTIDPHAQTYTEIFNQVTHNGLDIIALESAIQNAGGYVDLFGIELDNEAAANSLGLAFGLFSGVDPTNFDSTVAGYVAAGPTGDGILTTLAGINEPQLLTLPLTPGDGSTNFLPVGQTTKDFGTVKKGSPAQVLTIGRYTETALGGDVGDSSIGFVIQAAPFTEWFTYKDNAAGTQTTVNFGITMNPSFVGDFTAQFEWVQGSNRQLIILTLHVTVTA